MTEKQDLMSEFQKLRQESSKIHSSLTTSPLEYRLIEVQKCCEKISKRQDAQDEINASILDELHKIQENQKKLLEEVGAIRKEVESMKATKVKENEAKDDRKLSLNEMLRKRCLEKENIKTKNSSMPKFQYFVRLNGKTRTLNVNASDIVEKGKLQLCNSNRAWICYGGKPLSDHITFGEYRISNNSTIDLHFRI